MHFQLFFFYLKLVQTVPTFPLSILSSYKWFQIRELSVNNKWFI